MPTTKEIDVYKIARGDDPEIYEHIQHHAWTWAESDLRPENFLKGNWISGKPEFSRRIFKRIQKS